MVRFKRKMGAGPNMEKGTVRIVSNHSAFRKRNRFGASTHEAARMLGVPRRRRISLVRRLPSAHLGGTRWNVICHGAGAGNLRGGALCSGGESLPRWEMGRSPTHHFSGGISGRGLGKFRFGHQINYSNRARSIRLPLARGRSSATTPFVF